MDLVREHLSRRSLAFIHTIEGRGRTIAFWWVALASLSVGLKLGMTGPDMAGLHRIAALLPYALVIAAPMAAFYMACRWFPKDAHHPQPTLRLSRLGRWRAATADELAGPLNGPGGIMASLILGMLMNVPVRVLEFLAAMPVLRQDQPSWFANLFAWSLADVVLLSTLYVVAAVMALRKVPLFPRFLLFVWLADIAMQLAIAQGMAATPGLPAQVGQALGALLAGNLKKVLVSVALWLPYLLLSTRVNLTYRHRTPAERL